MTLKADALKVYFGAALFKSGELLGNLLLADAVSRVSGGDFVCVLPQDYEHREPQDFRAIRDADLKMLLDCDCALFSFDGMELDSGTVVEFMFAKSVDIPCALLRSDFRWSGDQGQGGGDPWNLMCSFHPRSERAAFDLLSAYRKLLDVGHGAESLPGLLSEAFAKEAVAALRKAVATPPLDKGGLDGAKAVLNWAAKAHGESFERLCNADPAFPDALLKRKISKGLI